MDGPRPLCAFALGICVALPLSLATPALHADDAPPVASVRALNLERYAGRWHEIAAFPMFLQRNCIADTTAHYALTPQGEVAVTNRCRTADGFDEARGKATVVEGSRNARLKVSFFWPFRSDYWVVGLDPDYRWAVVGNPNRKYLWILSRTPALAPELLDAALKAAAGQGYDLGQLKYTMQGGATPAK
ncbi:MAG: lipocalin family protein [Rhodocyclaceae bacterium]|nr:lipocalin family protein [Rhodocyclaceae bacterium]